MKKISRRALVLGVGGIAGYALSRKLGPGLPVLAGTDKLTAPADPLILNDASGLSPTPIYKHSVSTDGSDKLLETIRAALAESEQSNRSLCIGAARHSMGAQSIPRDGLAITFDNGELELDSANSVYRVHAGARWSQVIAGLDVAGWSPKVMQSNNDFGVAATYSVNAHGWPVPYGPMGSTVKAFRMVLADGSLVECSREKNADLFKHAMGGYGLLGVITDLDVEMVPNSRLIPAFEKMAAEGFSASFKKAVADPSVRMAYGRLNVERDDFFSDALLISYRDAENQQDLPAASGSGMMAHFASRIYRAQLGNETMKSFRWWNETVVGPKLGGGEVTRNSLINEPVVTLDDRNPDRTDILHEYFVGFDRFNEFLRVCREVIPASYQEFLNVTLRYVATDKESTLSYAPVPRIAAVMSFSQELTQRAESDMQRMTRALIEGVISIGGSYYLPYRPHATVKQFQRTYPGSGEFVAAKHKYDPKRLLRNNLWDSYLERI